MSLQGANNNQPQSIEDYKKLAKTIGGDNNAESVKNKVSIFLHGADNAVETANADGSISADEASLLTSWLSVISSVKSALEEKSIFKEAINQLQVMRETLLDFIEKGRNVYEPQETDAQEFKNVPLKMPWSVGQEDMEDVYNTLMNPVGKFSGVRNKPMAKVSAIESFIKEYKNRLTENQKLFLSAQIENWLNDIDTEIPQTYFQNISDETKVKEYWKAYKSAGYSNDIVAQLIVFGYSEKHAKEIKDRKV